MSERAALVERMAEAIAGSVYLTDKPTPHSVACWTPEAKVALAAVEAAGWGPRPEAVTLEEQGRLIAKLSATPGVRGGKLAVNAVLTSDVLRSRGITVEGQG